MTKYLFIINTPAHVHIYKNTIYKLLENGHEVKVFGRDYGCTIDLLDYFNLPYELHGKCKTKKASLIKEVSKQYVNIYRKAKRYNPDLVFGTSLGASAAFAALPNNTPIVNIMDNRPLGLYGVIFCPTLKMLTNLRKMDYSILSPLTVQTDLGDHHYKFNGFKETAYLHPDIFKPNPTIRDKLGVGPDEGYTIIRLNAFGSHHDFGKKGITVKQIKTLIDKLSKHTRLFISDEGGNLKFDNLKAEPFNIHPALMHDVLAEADLLIADTQTMVTEAALLGTPAIRSNNFVGENDMGNFIELENAGLIFNIKEFEDILDKALELLRDNNTKEIWEKKRKKFLKDKVNLTDLLVDIALNYDGSDTVERILQKYRKG